MAESKRRRWPYLLGVIAAILVVVAVLFRWDWFIPLVESRASAALGRPVTLSHLHVTLGRVPHIVADDVVIANPPHWPGGGNFATIDHLSVDVDALTYVRSRQLVLPRIEADHPVVDAAQTADGASNWSFPSGSSTSPGVQIGDLVVNDGHARVVVPKLQADLNLDIATHAQTGGPAQLVASAKGSYAGQPITAAFTGGALLSLRDAKQPYPVDLQLANGPTRITLVGSVEDPFHFQGADLKLELAGPDMSKLLPLTGIAIPQTPPYRIAGHLDWDAALVKFTDFTGKVGSSDLAGNLQVDTKPERPVVTADLRSKLVDLDDLGGFIGATPGKTATPGQTAEQRREVARAEASPKLLPDAPINLPKLTVADVHLTYHGEKLRGRSQPLDDITAKLDIENGRVTLMPLSFGVGQGRIAADIDMSPQDKAVHTKATIDFQRVDVGRLLGATHVAQGAGVIGGKAIIDGTGNSLAQVLGHGNGDFKFFMRGGGNVSALLVDLSGLQFGNALLSALGVPTRARIECLAANFVLQRGILSARTFLLDTDEDRVLATGDVNLRDEALNLTLRTESKHFSVGSLPTPIDVDGSLKSPNIHPEVGKLAVRAGAAAALSIVGTPLAGLLPTIQFGTGEDNACAKLLHADQAPHMPTASPRARRPSRH